MKVVGILNRRTEYGLPQSADSLHDMQVANQCVRVSLTDWLDGVACLPWISPDFCGGGQIANVVI